MAHLASHIDSPASGSLHFRQRIPIEGWVAEDLHRIRKIVAYSGVEKLGETTILFHRRDVSEALKIPANTAIGFRFHAKFNAFPGALVLIDVRALYTDGHEEILGLTELRIHTEDHTHAPYGDFCDPNYTRILHREHVYSSGHPSREPSPDCVRLLECYLRPGWSILDVGCGIGAYAGPLQKAGLSWIGCEVASPCLRELTKLGLPHRRVKQSRLFPWIAPHLPAHDGEFDGAIAIEVLEHVRRPDRFAAELRRIVRTRAIVSVPNMEILPLLSDQLVAPWHILEKDHRNFFSRASLHALLARHFRHVEVIDYGTIPVPSTNGIPLNYHLLAICDA